jgi:dTDP-4-amino-4,6-dideoxygalactose transaminase
MQVPFVNLKAQSAAIKEELMPVFENLFDNGAFIMGDTLQAFEEAFAVYCEANYAVGVGNGTDAITLALKAQHIGEADEVITAANTFIATAEGIVHAGAKPVFVDIDPQTYNMNIEQLEAAITYRTRAIIPVHLYGQPADMDPILKIAKERGLLVVEDAAHAHGATYKGRKAGSMGTAATFSFYPAKNLGACGDGGAVVTNDEQIAFQLRKLRDHGSVKKYEHDLVGYNSRLDALQAAALSIKLKHLGQWNEKRQRNAEYYREAFNGSPYVELPAVLEGASHVYHLFVVKLVEGRRAELQGFLNELGIQSGIHYPVPLHLSKAFQHLGYSRGDFPVAEECAEKILSLPMFPELNREQIAYVADSVNCFYSQ